MMTATNDLTTSFNNRDVLILDGAMGGVGYRLGGLSLGFGHEHMAVGSPT